MGDTVYRAPSVTMEQEQHCRVCEYHERCNFYIVLLKYIKNGWGKLTYDEVLTLMPMYDFDTAFAVDELCLQPVDCFNCSHAAMINAAFSYAKSQGNL